MIIKRIFLLLMFKCIIITAFAEDTIQIKHPKFISFQLAEGLVLPSSDIISDKIIAPNVAALSLRYGLQAKGDKWEDYYYGMPYKGIGFYKPFHELSREIGHPFSVFLFQGAQWKALSSGSSLHYEVNLGVSFNWRHYDVINHPNFIALGSSVNAHLGGRIFLKKPISDLFDLHIGMNFLHFSNGGIYTPNYGINTITANVELAYKINQRKYKMNTEKPEVSLIETEKRFVHDVSFFVTKRSLYLETVEIVKNNLRSKFPEHQFWVAGLNYDCLWRHSHRFMWGPSVNILYDEGQKVSFFVPETEDEHDYKEIITLGKMSERFSLGLSLKGELTMPGYCVFAQLGYDILSSEDLKEMRLYQIYGVKVHLFKGLSTSLGVKSSNLTQSKFLFISLGISSH